MKRIMIILVVLIAAALSVGVVGAQEPETPPVEEENVRPPRVNKLELIAEITGIDIETLRGGLQEEGATLASVIEANGGDAEAVQAALVDEIVERTGRDAEEVTAQVEEHLNSTRPQRGEGPGEGRRGGGRPGNGEGRPPFGGQPDNSAAQPSVDAEDA